MKKKKTLKKYSLISLTELYIETEQPREFLQALDDLLVQYSLRGKRWGFNLGFCKKAKAR